LTTAPRSGHRWPAFSTPGGRSGERRAARYRVDVTADLNDEDETGYLWTFLDEARDPGQITPGALVVAGDGDTAAVGQVAGLAPAGDGTIVHLRLLPGRVDDHRQLVERGLASWRSRLGIISPAWHHLRSSSPARSARRDTARNDRRRSAGRRAPRTRTTKAQPPGQASCARYAPGQAARERVSAGQGRAQQPPPEP
jgi:hypothetical protein